MIKQGEKPSILVCGHCGATLRPFWEEWSPVEDLSFQVSMVTCSCGHTDIRSKGDPGLALFFCEFLDQQLRSGQEVFGSI